MIIVVVGGLILELGLHRISQRYLPSGEIKDIMTVYIKTTDNVFVNMDTVDRIVIHKNSGLFQLSVFHGIHGQIVIAESDTEATLEKMLSQLFKLMDLSMEKKVIVLHNIGTLFDHYQF